MRVPILDLESQYRSLKEALDQAVDRVARSQRFILGPEVEAFERAAAIYLGAGHAIGVSSGSDALVCALLAHGIGQDDEVVTTPFSFFATVESILRVGARPRFVDIRPDTYELDFDALGTVMNDRTRAVLTVHVYGQPARVDRLLRVTSVAEIPVIEDAAQAFGASLGGRFAGTFGTIGCFSFQPTKPLGGFGDSGLIATSDSLLAERCRKLRVHGASAKHRHDLVGGNYRMDAIQAAVLNEKLSHLNSWLGLRQAHAQAYGAALRGVEGICLPVEVSNATSSQALYTIRVLDGRRESLGAFLGAHGIETAVHYPVPLHRQPILLQREFGAESGRFPVAEQASREVLSLPLYPELSKEQRDYVIEHVLRFFAN